MDALRQWHTFGHQAHAGSCRISCCTWASHSFTDASHSKGWSSARRPSASNFREQKRTEAVWKMSQLIFNPFFGNILQPHSPLDFFVKYVFYHHFEHNFSWFFRQSFSVGHWLQLLPMPSVVTPRSVWHRRGKPLASRHGAARMTQRMCGTWLSSDTLWWTNIAMENHHFSWENPL